MQHRMYQGRILFYIKSSRNFIKSGWIIRARMRKKKSNLLNNETGSVADTVTKIQTEMLLNGYLRIKNFYKDYFRSSPINFYNLVIK